jgi:molybdopterin-binding protein
MKMSTRNQLPGTVTAVEHGGVMSILVKATEVMLAVE